ncbi:DNA polymerase I [Dethiobacter alkaliphilus]|uniref:DNA polymerase I n=1 Tax=Dethiobacter alkaliphilus TaxID=427926 RepID=UPI002225D9C8|nr:DNA polymerase I [Dethiobacter alkaliphilus]MCW3490884.1 DNA polymerase I [Dethiobacter alkaliphilus]
MKEKGTFLIIDGSSLLYRAFFALPLLQTRQGLYTNAVYGFTSMLLKVLDEENPDYVVVAFDKAAPTFRHKEYSEYKGKRDKTPGELNEQISHVREVLAALHIPIVETEGYEADDLIGTMAKNARDIDIRPLIVSGDADIFQLVDIPAEVIYTKRGITQVERYNEDKLQERYGLTAEQYIDFKGLKGDPSDNIPGVPGVGEKTAIKLLKQFGTLEKIYENLDELKGKLLENLAQHKEQAFLSKRLATIVKDVPMEESIKDFARQEPDSDELRRLFEQLEFKSLLEKLPADGDNEETKQKETAEPSYLVEGEEGYAELRAAMEKASKVAVLVLPVGVSWQEKPEGFSVAVADKTYYLPITGENGLSKIMELLTGHQALTVVYDAKTWHNLSAVASDTAVFDVSLAAYLLDPLENGYPPQKLAARYLDRILPEEPKKKKGEAVCNRDFSCAAVRTLYDLYPLLDEKLKEASLDHLYEDLELPLAYTLARMERTGVAVDLQALDAMKTEFRERIGALEKEIYSLAGEEFNLNSPKQLGQILFDKLGLPALKKTKTGYSTDAKVLEELAPHHEVVAKILKYRTLIKILTTYLEGLSKLVNEQTGRIHTHFNQTVTATGRLSSTEPNLQNIPIRLEEGRRVRRAFVPGKKGNLLLSADYSQIELRILAHVSKDPVLIDSFRNEEDIHRRTAAEVFGVLPEDVTSELRDRAKAVNFGIVYGISDYGLSQQLKIPRQEAKEYISRYFERLPGVRDFIHNVVEDAKKNGYVTTLLNRRRYLPDINAKNFNQRSFAERTAMNTPIQGTAADIIKLAMLRVEEALAGMDDVQMVLQVHDDLVFEVKEESLINVARLVKKQMESALELAVPLTVDVKAGLNWAEMNKVNL